MGFTQPRIHYFAQSCTNLPSIEMVSSVMARSFKPQPDFLEILSPEKLRKRRIGHATAVSSISLARGWRSGGWLTRAQEMDSISEEALMKWPWPLASCR